MQLTVNRHQLIDKINANLSDIEQAAQAELDRLDVFRAEQRAHADALAAYFELLAQGLRNGTIIEGDGQIVERNGGGVVGAMSLTGESYQLPTRPKNPNPGRDYLIDRAVGTMKNALEMARKSHRAAVSLLELGTEETVQIDDGYEKLIGETINFHHTSVNFGLPA